MVRVLPAQHLASDDGQGHRTPRSRDAIDRLDYVASMGFDVLYLPPIHPIGVVNRKGRNNTTEAAPDDVGSPWGIADHIAVHPDLGTLADVHALVAACRERGIELALDIAFQCTPDHPWVTEHPDWFSMRADGTIQYAENPPKKYQDIYPINFETDDWQSLVGGPRRRVPLLDRAGRHDLPRRQPAHQGVPVLGVVHRARSATSTPRRSSSPRRSPDRG